MAEAEIDRLGDCECPLRCVGHTHTCLAERLARVERVLNVALTATPPEKKEA